MRASYDTRADAGSIWLIDSGVSADSGSVLDDLVFDCDADDRIIGIEILNASLHLPGDCAEGKEVSPGVMLAYDAAGHIVAIEFRPASKLISPAALKALARK